MTAARMRLPNRRLHHSEAIEIAGKLHRIGFGHVEGGRISEIFIDGHRIGSPAQAVLDDSAVMASMLLQHGYTAADLTHRLTPDSALRLILERAAELDREGV